MATSKHDAFISYSHVADGKLADALERGLQRFAKPIFKLRGMRVFRDQSNLSLTPHLWGDIQEALSDSDYFLLLASPESATSSWVSKELEYWIDTKGVETIFIVQTEGEIAWDEATDDYDWVKTTSLPEVLKGVFSGEPLYLDARWTRAEPELSLEHDRFTKSVAQIVAAIRRCAVEDVYGEELQHHKKTIRLRNGAIALLALLTAASLIAAVIAIGQKSAAERALALAHWGRGIESRDGLNRPNEAAHWFAKAAGSPDHLLADAGRFAATQAVRGVRLLQAIGEEELASDEEALEGVAFTADGARIVSWLSDGTVRAWDAVSGKAVMEWMLLADFKGTMSNMALNADGSRILSWSENTVEAWNLATGKKLPKPLGHPGVEGAVFNADGSRILSWSVDRVRMWDVELGKETMAPLRQRGVVGAALNTDGSRILSWSEDRVRMWDVKSGKETMAPLSLTDPVTSEFGGEVAFNADGSRILSSSKNRVRMWDAMTGKETIEPLRHSGVLGAVFNADGSRILSWSEDGTVRLWDAATGKEMIPPLQHEGWVLGAAFNPVGNRVMSWSMSFITPASVRVWELAMNKEAVEPLRHEETVEGAVLSPDETHLLSWSGNSLRVWDVVTGEEAIGALRHQGAIGGAAFTRDGTRILTRSGNTLRVWDVATGEAAIEPLRHEGAVVGAMFTADETRILSWSGVFPEAGIVRLWDVATGKEVMQPLRHESTVWGATLNVDATRILSWSSDMTVRLWDVAKGEEIVKPMQQEGVGGAMFNAGETLILSWGGYRLGAGTVRLWEVATGKEAMEPMRHEGAVEGATFNADQTRVLSWDGVFLGFGTVRLWDVATGKEAVEQLRHDEQTVRSAAFSPDQSRIMSRSEHTLRLWDVVAAKEAVAPLRHEEAVKGAVFNADGTRILSWSGNTLLVWEVATGKEAMGPLRHEGTVRGAAFTRDGGGILSWSEDGTVRLWDVSYDTLASAEALILEIQARTGTHLTKTGELEVLSTEEWRRVKAEYDRQLAQEFSER